MVPKNYYLLLNYSPLSWLLLNNNVHGCIEDRLANQPWTWRRDIEQLKHFLYMSSYSKVQCWVLAPSQNDNANAPATLNPELLTSIVLHVWFELYTVLEHFQKRKNSYFLGRDTNLGVSAHIDQTTFWKGEGDQYSEPLWLWFGAILSVLQMSQQIRPKLCAVIIIGQVASHSQRSIRQMESAEGKTDISPNTEFC